MIRHKLSLALAAWHPSDRSAKFILLPWHNVFSKGDMDALLVRNILPKLAQTLDEFTINPQHQILGNVGGLIVLLSVVITLSLATMIYSF